MAKDVAYCSRSFCFCFFQKLIFFSFCIFLHFAQITYALPEIMNIIITGGDEKVEVAELVQIGEKVETADFGGGQGKGGGDRGKGGERERENRTGGN